MEVDFFSGGEVADVLDDLVFSGTPAECAARILEARENLLAAVSSGGVRAIDYESAGEPRGSGGVSSQTPRGLWAVEMLADVDKVLAATYRAHKALTHRDYRRDWRVWCLYRRPWAAWTLDALAAFEGLTTRQVRDCVSRVDGTLYEELRRREWRIR